jgi:predicted Zn-dependent protease
MRTATRLWATILVAVSLIWTPPAARAAVLIRDAAIEHALSELARPVLNAAGLSPGRVQVLVVRDSSLNAFVVDNRHIFIHSGMLLRMKDAEMLQSVIAHEAAHIANGHILRRGLNAGMANTVAGLGIALAAAVAMAGQPEAAAGLGAGMSGSASHVFMSHTRAEESAADASGLRYMARAGVPPGAFADVMEMFRGQEVLSSGRQDPYARTHPLTRDRLRAIEARVAALDRQTAAPDSNADYWYARATGKLSAFLRAPGWTLPRLDDSLTPDIALMRKAVAYHRMPDVARAISAVDELARMRPQDPFVHELRGQILLESRRTDAAVAAYRRAAELAPENAMVLAGMGRALLAAGRPGAALDALERARAQDFRDPRMLRDLAGAYAQRDRPGMAALITAERYALIGRLEDAEINARRAENLLPRGSSAWLRAQDVVSATEAELDKRR